MFTPTMYVCMYVCMLYSFIINELLRLFGISLGRDKVYLVHFNHLQFFFLQKPHAELMQSLMLKYLSSVFINGCLLQG